MDTRFPQCQPRTWNDSAFHLRDEPWQITRKDNLCLGYYPSQSTIFSSLCIVLIRHSRNTFLHYSLLKKFSNFEIKKKLFHKKNGKVVTVGFEPTKRDALDLKSSPVDQAWVRYQCIHDGIRTRNLQIRSLTRYPVAPHGQYRKARMCTRSGI